MELSVNEKKKIEITDYAIENGKWVKIAKTFRKVIVIAFIVSILNFLFLIYTPGILMYTNARTGEILKDDAVITLIGAISIGITFFLLFLSPAFVFKAKEYACGVPYTNENVNITDEAVIISYGVEMETNKNERYEITMPFIHITKVTYCKDTKLLKFEGQFSQEWYSNYLIKKRKAEPMSGEQFEIYDYFEPSLLKVVKSKELNVICK